MAAFINSSFKNVFHDGTNVSVLIFHGPLEEKIGAGELTGPTIRQVGAFLSSLDMSNKLSILLLFFKADSLKVYYANSVRQQ